MWHFIHCWWFFFLNCFLSSIFPLICILGCCFFYHVLKQIINENIDLKTIILQLKWRICVIVLKADHCNTEKSYFNTFSPPQLCSEQLSPQKAMWKSPSELVEMLSPLQQQQGSGHGSKHPTCPKLAAKWPITRVKAGEKGLGKIWLLLNSAKL